MNTRTELWQQRIVADMRRLTTGIRSDKCVVRRFRRCANVIERTGVLISPYPDQEGNKLQRQKILMFIYPIYNHNWRNISTIYVYIYIYTYINSTNIYIYIYIYIQGVPGGMCQTSGECSLS